MVLQIDPLQGHDGESVLATRNKLAQPFRAVVGDDFDAKELRVHDAISCFSWQVGAKPMASKLARIASEYLTKFPELGRLWKNVYLNRRKF